MKKQKSNRDTEGKRVQQLQIRIDMLSEMNINVIQFWL